MSSLAFEYILKPITLLIFLLLSSQYAAPLGGGLYAVIMQILRIPFLGRIFNFLTNGRIKLVLLFKLMAWMVSSSGLLLGIGIYYAFWGYPTNLFELWILLISTSVIILNIVYDIMYFQMFSFKEHIDYLGEAEFLGNMGKEYHEYVLNDKKLQKTLSRTLFVDLQLPRLIRLIVSIGIFFYAFGNLGLLEFSEGRNSISVLEALRLSFSFVPFVEIDQEYFVGDNWLICKIVTAFLIFLWSVFFIASARSFFYDEADIPTKEANEDLQSNITLNPKNLFEENEFFETQCTATIKSGERCKRKAKTGLNRCYQHID